MTTLRRILRALAALRTPDPRDHVELAAYAVLERNEPVYIWPHTFEGDGTYCEADADGIRCGFIREVDWHRESIWH